MFSEKKVPLFIWIVCLFGDLFVFFQFHTSHSNPIWIQYNGGFDSLEASQKEKHPMQDYLKWKSWNVFVRVRWVLIFLSITYSSIHLKGSLRHCCQADNKLYIYSLSVKFLVSWLCQFKPAIARDSTANTNFISTPNNLECQVIYFFLHHLILNERKNAWRKIGILLYKVEPQHLDYSF